ncbi:unnamed protein product [Durusdinium trenchii]|uniref:Phytanoyl-CoA dioxygenase n=2 Tax=Durusdinium trenchii TaxID=1381693 RepID=A0ABP0I009_9DINO
MIAVRRIRQISALLRPPSGVGYRTFSHQGLAPSPQTVQIAAAEREAYQRDGVVHLPGAFSEDWVTYLREAFQQGMEKPGKYAEFIGKETTWETLFETTRNDVQMFQDQVFYAEATERVPAWQPLLHSHAAQLIAELMGSAAVSFFYLHAILKRGGCEQAIPWHQDLPYWKVDGRQIGSVWIALDDMPLAAWGLFRPQHFVDHSSYTGREDLPLLPDVDGLLQTGRANALAFEVKAGDALCFDARIVHGSLGNPEVVQEHRRIALRFGGDDATYCDREGETAIPTPEIDATHGLRHGDALTCEAFPRVWP